MTQEEIIHYLYVKNGTGYNIHKASEELQELSLILTQKLTKPTKVNDQNIIDEIGDVIIRLEVLKKIFPADLIEKRIEAKLAKYEGCIKDDSYIKI